MVQPRKSNLPQSHRDTEECTKNSTEISNFKSAILFSLTLSVSLCLCGTLFCHADPPAFRTDASPPTDKTPWFQLKPHEFPPENSSHYIAGELISLDHVNRTGTLRPDRTDAIRRGDWDKPMPFTLLPYASLAYHGAPAELRDIPI